MENPAHNNLKIKMLINKLIDDKTEQKKKKLCLSFPWQFLVLYWNIFNFYLCVYWSHFEMIEK